MLEAAHTILVIDDEEIVRESLTDHLEDRGFRVLTAENGRIGLEIFHQESPDLILTDLRMPEMDGLELLDRVVKNSPDTPVIVVSGTGNITDSVQALRSGAWDYILKPVTDMSIVSYAVGNALERAALKRENAAQQVRLAQAYTKMRDDEDAGRKVQMKLLPATPLLKAPYTFTQCIVPSTGLSGDFVDYFSANSNQLIFYTADVSGHGISSALVTVLLRSFMSKQIDKYENQDDDTLLHPARLLTRLNHEFLEQNLNKHITIFYAVLNRPSNTLSYASGGQFPAPILFTDAGAEPLIEHGIAVGLFPDATYQTSHRTLANRFMLAVYSDGILETLPADTLPDKLDFLTTLDTPEKIAAAMKSVKKIRELPDDVAVLTVNRKENK
jgi:sigma-B regulation protein RsbU (phosphoserine phosphatase)